MDQVKRVLAPRPKPPIHSPGLAEPLVGGADPPRHVRPAAAVRRRSTGVNLALAVLPATPLHLPPNTTEGCRIAEKVIAGFPTCPIPEVAPLRRTLKAWRQQVLPYFDTSRVSNSVTEVINLITEKVRGSPTDSKTLIITDSGSRSPHPATAHTADNHDHAQLRRPS